MIPGFSVYQQPRNSGADAPGSPRFIRVGSGVMESLFRYKASASPCGYLPEQQWSLEYEYVAAMTRGEYLQRMLDGWRRFGTTLFRPACTGCAACRPIRILAREFRPDRSQRRTRKANEGEITLRIGTPSVTPAKLELYDRYHSFQTELKDWPEHPPKDARSYADSFVHHPFPVEEWCYYRAEQLVGVGYVDHLPDDPEGGPPLSGVQGLSAIYFFYDPNERHRSLGTWNVLSLIDGAIRRGLPYVYLGYYVAGCRSMEYKTRFLPHEIRSTSGEWRVESGE
jgi:leucyl-tRNA---protein transferase